MPTPYAKIKDVFHTKFQSKDLLDYDMENQFLINAIGDFSLDLFDISYNETTEEIIEELSQSEINLLGTLMYKFYLGRERDRALKLNNIIGRDIKLTGMSDTKFALNKAYEELSDEIELMISKMKDSSYGE